LNLFEIFQIIYEGWQYSLAYLNHHIMDKEIFVSACNFIGLLNESKNSWEKFKKSKLKISEEEIKKKIDERNNARKNKDYKAADEIRNELLSKGVLIEDKDDKTLWKFK